METSNWGSNTCSSPSCRKEGKSMETSTSLSRHEEYVRMKHFMRSTNLRNLRSTFNPASHENYVKEPQMVITYCAMETVPSVEFVLPRAHHRLSSNLKQQLHCWLTWNLSPHEHTIGCFQAASSNHVASQENSNRFRWKSKMDDRQNISKVM